MWDARDGEYGAAFERIRTRVTEQVAADTLHALQERDRYLAIVSHELRQPVNAAIAALRVLDLPGAAGAKARVVLNRQLLLVAELLDDLLDLSRLTLKAFNLHIQPVDVRSVLDSVFATVEPIAAQKNQTVTLFLCEEPMWTDGDSIRLHQVFVNLLSNAVRYTPDGGRIHLTATAAPEALTIEVADSGQGMSAKELPEIFKPFVRGDSSEGLGIGLALVNGIVELHGGVIRARSAGRDCGSRFTVTLPRRGAPRGH